MSTPPDPRMLAVLDPRASAVVEACAGSGKTWLLAARIVRLLLAGAAPAEILAITFTRKAAREIEARVVAWLRFLAGADDAAVREFLAERGAACDGANLAAARGLYERVVAARPGLAVNTFHGWFLQLVQVAPLSANLAGTTLAEDGSRRFDELWQGFAAALAAERKAPAAIAFVRLFESIGREATKRLLRAALARRAEWLALAGGDANAAARETARLATRFGATDEAVAAATFLGDTLRDRARACADLFAAGNATERGAAAAIEAALAAGNAAALLPWRAALLTAEGEPRKLLATVSDAMARRLGRPEAERAVALYGALCADLQAALAAQQEARNFALNRDALLVFEAFLAHLAGFKRARRQIDFVDAEWEVLKLAEDEESAAFVQARLDARYRHVLLDEFQDTNPLQWRILLAWLAAYDDAARPTVFLVGDPKQSIYRFRGAEPRLFATAAAFLRERYAAVTLEKDETRRNAPAIVAVVNALFGAEAEFAPFRTQSSAAHGLPGAVELLPLAAAAAAGDDDAEAGGERDRNDRAGAAAAPGPAGADATAGLPDASAGRAAPAALRDPLREPAAEQPDVRRQREAAALAARLAAMLGRTLIREHGCERPLQPGDVLLLVRARTQIAVYEQALAAAGIPYAAASRGGLLAALEVRDIVALLEFLVTPAADLPLAHALKSPLFACSDDDLLRLAARDERSWCERLAAAAAVPGCPAPLVRAAGLVERWLTAAGQLPAHDLLDRIYAEGEVIARYRLAVPAARRAAALANLEALLLFALDFRAGRYPSLARFIDELKALARGGGDDAPDEGEIATDDTPAADGRVRILTIHGAKGLEAPLVWLLDANAAARGDDAWRALVDWPPGAAAPTHFSFVGTRKTRGSTRAAVFAADEAGAAREELNLLYVALTRARQLFFASGSARSGGSGGSGGVTPYARLAAALARLGDATRHGETLPQAVAAPAGGAAERSAPSLPAVVPAGERREAPDAAARFGILLHAALERRSEDRAGDGWWRPLGYSDAEHARVSPVAERLLAAPALARFFDPARYRRAWNELEIAAADGAIIRLDRLVECDDALWVLDYKSSTADTPRLADYREQVAAYCRAVAVIFPGRPLRGALIFSDATLAEVFP